jgi:hypothetical protein
MVLSISVLRPYGNFSQRSPVTVSLIDNLGNTRIFPMIIIGPVYSLGYCLVVLSLLFSDIADKQICDG